MQSGWRGAEQGGRGGGDAASPPGRRGAPGQPRVLPHLDVEVGRVEAARGDEPSLGGPQVLLHQLPGSLHQELAVSLGRHVPGGVGAAGRRTLGFRGAETLQALPGPPPSPPQGVLLRMSGTAGRLSSRNGLRRLLRVLQVASPAPGGSRPFPAHFRALRRPLPSTPPVTCKTRTGFSSRRATRSLDWGEACAGAGDSGPSVVLRMLFPQHPRVCIDAAGVAGDRAVLRGISPRVLTGK